MEYADIYIPCVKIGKSASLVLFNALGKELVNLKVTETPYHLARNGLPSGLYYLWIDSGESTYPTIEKVIFFK